jgi:hypothetical protein
MSFNVFPIGAGPPSRQGAEAETPADVVDLASRRPDAVEAPPMPDGLWDEVDDAARRWLQLRDEGREIRFQLPPDGGRIRATLREVRGGVERPLPLTELFGPRGDGPPAAA